MSNFTFAQVPIADIPRSKFNRSHTHKTTFDSGYLIPFFVDEVLPGDTFKANVHMFARFATPIYPIMDNLHMESFFFFVPNRLIWNKWQRFMGEQLNPGDSTDFTIPQIVAPAVSGFAEGSLFDYFGMPVGVPGISVSALWARAYHLIYNEWFRDENLVLKAWDDWKLAQYEDGPDDAANYSVRRRGKRHDYFTSALPWPQKGEAVSLPMGTTAPVVPVTAGAVPNFQTSSGYAGVLSVPQMGTAAPVSFSPGADMNSDLGWNNTNLMTDLSEATSATINALRLAFQTQKLLERDARGGTRYTELIRSHFGVVSPDARLQRPEFLGGGHVNVNINPVVQTSGSAPGGTGYTDNPQGHLAAFGTAGGSVGFAKSFVEHGVILGLVMVRADLSYQQGLPRMFSRRTRFDFYWPVLSHLGEQDIKNQEIYCQGPAVVDGATGKAVDDLAFGYQERWAEYRYFPSKITGKFRSGIPGGSLDSWHLAQEFTALPTLNQEFIEERPPVARVIAVQTEPHFIFDSHIALECTRPMPVYSVPGLIDHF